MKPLLKFIPLLVVYLIFIFAFSKQEPLGDERRYLMYATNITNGFYTDAENPSFRNGPGYPVYLALYLKLKTPLAVPKYVNAILVLIAIFWFYKALSFYIPESKAVFASYLLGLYYPMFIWLPRNMSDIPAFFLICGVIYFSLRLMQEEKFKVSNFLKAGFCLGWLILTKFIFAYVVFVSLILGLGIFLIFRNKKALKWAGLQLFGLLFLVPYLIYTYQLTGKGFLLDSNGGETMYWMSTHYPNEYGRWIGREEILDDKIPDIHPQHKEFFNSLLELSELEKNERFKEKAIENIKQNPGGYAINVVSNILRLIFDYPDSYRYQNLKMYFFLPVNMILLVLFFFSLYPVWIYRKKIPIELLMLFAFILIYFGGSSLVSARARYFLVVAPFLIFWIAYFYHKYISITLKE